MSPSGGVGATMVAQLDPKTTPNMGGSYAILPRTPSTWAYNPDDPVTGNVLPTNAWTHFCFTVDGNDGGKFTAYLNGTQVYSRPSFSVRAYGYNNTVNSDPAKNWTSGQAYTVKQLMSFDFGCEFWCCTFNFQCCGDVVPLVPYGGLLSTILTVYSAMTPSDVYSVYADLTACSFDKAGPPPPLPPPSPPPLSAVAGGVAGLQVSAAADKAALRDDALAGAATAAAIVNATLPAAQPTTIPFNDTVLFSVPSPGSGYFASPLLTVLVFDSVAATPAAPTQLPAPAALPSGFCGLDSPTSQGVIVAPSAGSARLAAIRGNLNGVYGFFSAPGTLNTTLTAMANAVGTDARVGLVGSLANRTALEVDDGASGFAMAFTHANGTLQGLYMRVCAAAVITRGGYLRDGGVVLPPPAAQPTGRRRRALQQSSPPPPTPPPPSPPRPPPSPPPPSPPPGCNQYGCPYSYAVTTVPTFGQLTGGFYTALDRLGQGVYVADPSSSQIWWVNINDGGIAVMAGGGQGSPGYRDGPAGLALFGSLGGIAADVAGTVRAVHFLGPQDSSEEFWPSLPDAWAR